MTFSARYLFMLVPRIRVIFGINRLRYRYIDFNSLEPVAYLVTRQKYDKKRFYSQS